MLLKLLELRQLFLKTSEVIGNITEVLYKI